MRKELFGDQHVALGCALAFAAGVFLCIALADLLPECGRAARPTVVQLAVQRGDHPMGIVARERREDSRYRAFLDAADRVRAPGGVQVRRTSIRC